MIIKMSRRKLLGFSLSCLVVLVQTRKLVNPKGLLGELGFIFMTVPYFYALEPFINYPMQKSIKFWMRFLFNEILSDFVNFLYFF